METEKKKLLRTSFMTEEYLLVDYNRLRSAVPGSVQQELRCFLFNFRQPPNDVEMALGGTLLPSISTFASGPAVKSKNIGSANLVSSAWSPCINACQNAVRVSIWEAVASAVYLQCCNGLMVDNTLCWGVTTSRQNTGSFRASVDINGLF